MGDRHEKRTEVSFIGDFNQTISDDVVLVESDSDYVDACVEITRNEINATEKVIWVRKKNHYAWLRNFVEQVDAVCCFQEKTARLILAERWNVTLPEWLDDETVLTQHLLSLEVDRSTPTTFTIRILSHLFNSAFESTSLGQKNLAVIIGSLVSSRHAEHFLQYPILKECLQEKCSEWRSNTAEAWVKDICNLLPTKAKDVWLPLSAWSILNGYPSEVIEYMLTPSQLSFVRKVPPVALQDLPISPDVRNQILDQIRMFFTKVRAQVTNSIDFQKVLEYTSGRLSDEFNQVTSILRSNQFDPERDDIEKTKDKFATCSEVSKIQLKALTYLVKPQKPTRISNIEQWKKGDWVQWTINEYLPYRSWQIHNRQFDAEVEQDVQQFSEWYVSEYVSIQQNPEDSLVLSLHKIAKNWDDALVIIAVVDCLPINFMQLIDDSLKKEGFSQHERTFCFSALPTVTEHNKPQLLSGQWSIKKKSYGAILKQRTQEDWQDREVKYVGNLRELSELTVPTAPATIVLNLIDGDEMLHEDMEAKNTTHEEELSRLYVRMAETLRRMVDEWVDAPTNFHVHVVTDHGACRILEHEKKSFDSQVVNRIFPEEKYRFATISEDEADQIPQNLWDIGFRFKAPFGTTNEIFFIPKGHNTVRSGGKAGSYMHGGATPEEVIVPISLYKPTKATWKLPLYKFNHLDLEKDTGKAKFFIQRVVTLELEIQNPNQTELRIIKSSVLSPDTDLKEYQKPIIPAEGASVMKLACYFRKAALKQSWLEIDLKYEISDESHSILVSLESHFKSAMATGINLKDL